MTREEAIKALKGLYDGSEAILMAIEALSEETSTIQEKHQLSEETSTNTPTKSTNISTNTPIEALKLTFENDTEIKSCSKDSDLIGRAEAIEAIELVDWYHQNSNKDMVHGANDDEHQAWYKADDVYKALEAVPSADRPRGEQYKKGFEDAKRAFLVEYARESQNMRKRIAQLEARLNAQKAISADRPRGRWHYSDGKPATIGQSFGVICDQCGTESEYCTNFCGECGADMRGDMK